MLWRYSETHTTDAKNIAGIKVAQDQRPTGILTLLDEELGKKKFLLGDKTSACDYFLFMLALWSENLSRPTASFANLLRFMCELSQRPAVKRVCEIKNIYLNRYY
ncbi:MAG: glutathione binding-like protein [Alphaproteobacteria bacterium]